MHVPDGVLSPSICLAAAPLASAAVAVSLWNWRKEFLSQSVATPSVLQATGVGCALFALQMCNFAIPGQAFSGHLMGGALATMLLGPWAACVVMAAILTIQASIFGDGGLVALGVNVLNIGVIPVAVTALLLQSARTLHASSLPLRSMAWFTIAGISVIAAVLALAIQLAVGAATTIDTPQTAYLLIQTHLPIAVGEGLITALLAAILIPSQPVMRMQSLFALSLLILLLAPSASILPDGLEATGQVAGFLATAQTWEAWLPDYTIPGLATPFWSTALAGLVGVALTGSLVVLTEAFIVRCRIIRRGA